MRIALIVPTFHYNDKTQFLSLSDFPTGLAYLASSLKQAGHEVIGINPNNIAGYASYQQMMMETIHKGLRDNDPDLIGIGGICTDYQFIRDAIATVKMRTPKPIVLGGGIVNNDAEYIFNLLKPDYAIVGEGEEAIVQLANGVSPEEIPNLWYWKDGEARFTREDYNYKPLDGRPFPDYEPFGVQKMLDEYSMATRLLYRYSRPHPRPFVITTARSCPFNCTFCVHNHGSKYRARTVENVIQEIKEMYEKYQFNILIMMDELFAVNKQRMKEMCGAIINGRETYGWDFDWMFQTHASANLDLETLKLAKKAGCFFFSYGIESASPRVLESMNKKAKVGQFIEAIKLSREAKVGFSGNLIFGDPAENDETISESLTFWINHCKSEFVFTGTVYPYPGSKLFDDCLKKGLITDKLRYYETIDKTTYNLTSMTDDVYDLRLSIIHTMGNSWALCPLTTAHKVDIDNDKTDETLRILYGGDTYKITAKCPVCGEEIIYRQILRDWGDTFYIGVGCTHCNRKVRVNLLPKGEYVKRNS
jgi:radical SAM superfamily enzyme YgiQ (UPF0313 family)